MAGRGGAATEDDTRVIVDYVVAHFGLVNVNRASEGDLVEIVQLSASDAAAIVEFRMREGEFRTLDDLRKVQGVDFATIQERKDRIVFTGP
jgi:competence protein ComEA